MELLMKTAGRTLIVSIKGDIDHHTAAEAKNKIDKKMDRENIANIIFDFSGVSFMDSSGIGMIIGRFKRIEKLGGVTAICRMAAPVKRIFTLSGLGKIVKTYATLDEALGNIRREGF